MSASDNSSQNSGNSDSSEPPPQPFWQLLDNLKKAVWKKRSILMNIMDKHGAKPLYEYAQDFLDVNKSPVLDSRKPELINLAGELIEERLGKTVAKGVVRQLNSLPLVSTADHHGTINHPFFLNSNIISGIPAFDNPDIDAPYLIVFSFASVSINNASAYPRGIEFHGGINGSGNLIRLPILPDKMKMSVVYGSRSFTRKDLDKALCKLAKRERNGLIVSETANKIREILEKYFGADDILNAPDLVSQITKINFNLWPSFFHDEKGTRKLNKKTPDLVYLDIETLVSELFIRYHLENGNSLIYKLLFDRDYRKLSLKYFNNLAGGFSLEKEWGTYLFWALDDKKHRVRLVLDESKGILYSPGKGYEIPLTPESIRDCLRAKKIFPSMLFCYLIVSLYYGMKCLGGFCQVHDLTRIKEAFCNLLKEMSHIDEISAIASVQTKELGGDGMVLSYLKTQKGDLVPATGIDMAIETMDTSFEKYVELSKRVTLSEIMNPMFLEIYTVLYCAQDRDPEFLKLTPERIVKETRIDEKLFEGF